MSELAHDRAAQINEAHRAGNAAALDALEHSRRALEHYYRAGVLLNEQKAELPHGTWLPWLEANFEGDPRTAQRYMRLADNWPAIQAKYDTVSHLSLSKALMGLTEPKELQAEDVADIKDFLPRRGFVKVTPPISGNTEARSALITPDPRSTNPDVYLYGSTDSTATRTVLTEGIVSLISAEGWPPLDKWDDLPTRGDEWERLYTRYFELSLIEPEYRPAEHEEPTGYRALHEHIIPAIEAAEFFAKVRDKKLYRDRYATFEDYCAGRFGLDADGIRAVLEIIQPDGILLRDTAIGIMCERDLTFKGALDYMVSEFQKHQAGAA